MEPNYQFDTSCVHGGYCAPSTEPQVPPITQSTTYRYYNTDDVAAMFDLTSATHMYTRLSNPTVSILEEKMATLEGGVGAAAASSGQSATMICMLALCRSGDHILASSHLYGGTFNLVGFTFEQLGIQHSFVDPELSVEEILQHAKPNTRVVLGETVGNPSMSVLDFEKWSRVAKELGVPFVVDNTLATPYLCKPLQHGADIVIHSTTKYSDGHATSVGGMVIDGGSFDWAKSGNYPGLSEPDESYHGLCFTESFGEKALAIKLRAQMLRDLGCVMAPMNAWLTIQGLDTLHLRMQRHSENAQVLAEHLSAHPKVDWINYPGLPGNRYHALQQKYMPKGAGGFFPFAVKGGFEAGRRFIEHLQLTSLVVHIGDVRTSVLHPASATHRQLSEADQRAAGIDPGLIRVSVGIEDIGDIIKDFDQALEKV
ncbi:O-acetylhomoserine aminocarboxypropyltransferase/cysteine synthase [Ruminococcaceae bacterium OttesenSCG-928-I18]|nr:O-acetylhomoserine aminocarboxypropyltransferase/cysteine synthase [Ruminococcaceae bacterium OttesenSCG-928-I18]